MMTRMMMTKIPMIPCSIPHLLRRLSSCLFVRTRRMPGWLHSEPQAEHSRITSTPLVPQTRGYEVVAWVPAALSAATPREFRPRVGMWVVGTTMFRSGLRLRSSTSV